MAEDKSLKAVFEKHGIDVSRIPDLSRMASVDVPAFLESLKVANFIVAFYPDGRHTILDETAELAREVLRTGEAQRVGVCAFKVANIQQTEWCAAARQLMESGQPVGERMFAQRLVMMAMEVDNEAH